MPATPKVWFVTGSSRGFGRVWTRAALERGDSVVATARSAEAVTDLVADYPDRALALPLDITDRGAVIEAVRAGHEHFGRLDVIVNNAGFGLFAAVEETTEAQARAQLETNLLGPLWVVQAALPYLRAQGSGHILQVSSLSGVATFPLLGLYQASKWALEGLSETLAGEVAGFGIKVTLLEPGAFRTEWAGVSADHAEEMPAYDDVRASIDGHENWYHHGRPEATTELLFEIVDSAEPPLRVLLGRSATPLVRAVYESRLATWTTWESRGYTAGGAD
ncbi:MAG TPA: SDR family NAD(P)-dependent oxidoreductase [Actinopolymorphaceae bacterium]|jgi:NAD(P)-dependent dehydrogenase (short-subunit alcohol dehydrogenase family)